MSDDRNRFNYLTHAAEEGNSCHGPVTDYDREAAEMRKPRDTSVEFKINGPFVHNLRKKKPVNRKLFTFKGMQSTHGVTHRIQESKVYNNIYPDAPTDSGLVYFSLTFNCRCIVLRRSLFHCGGLKSDQSVNFKLKVMRSGKPIPLLENSTRQSVCMNNARIGMSLRRKISRPTQNGNKFV